MINCRNVIFVICFLITFTISLSPKTLTNSNYNFVSEIFEENYIYNLKIKIKLNKKTVYKKIISDCGQCNAEGYELNYNGDKVKDIMIRICDEDCWVLFVNGKTFKEEKTGYLGFELGVNPSFDSYVDNENGFKIVDFDKDGADEIIFNSIISDGYIYDTAIIKYLKKIEQLKLLKWERRSRLVESEY